MELLNTLSKEDVREFFSKNWLTHDAMWYGASVQELGPQKANQLNKTAVKLMAGIEIKRVLALMGMAKDVKITRFKDMAEIIKSAFFLIQTDFMKFDFSFPEKNLMWGRFNQCFAYEGVNKFGMIDAYECGIVERVKGWLGGLGVSYVMTPDVKGCLMHETGSCEIKFSFSLE